MNTKEKIIRLTNEMIMLINKDEFYNISKVSNVYEMIISNELHTLDNVFITEQSSIIYKIIDVLNSNFEKSIIKGDYNNLERLEKTIYKLSKINEQLINKTSKEDKNNTTNDLLSDNIKLGNGVLITDVTNKLRGLGKSQALLEFAKSNNCTIIVNTHSNKQYLDNMSNELNIGKIDIRYISTLDSLRAVRLSNNSFVTDDGIGNEIITKLVNNGYKFLGGFNNLSTSTKEYENKIKNYLENKLDITISQIRVLTTMEAPPSLIVNLTNKEEVLKELLYEFGVC